MSALLIAFDQPNRSDFLSLFFILGVNFFFDACGVPPYFTVAADNTTQPASIARPQKIDLPH